MQATSRSGIVSRLPLAPLGKLTIAALVGDALAFGPFNVVGTFHIYCTVHPGMNLTVIVQ